MRKKENFAHISECGCYRYMLTRAIDGDGAGIVTFVMLNPSTADATIDDPTIRKCKGFAQRWGFATLIVVNVLAWRATKPRDLPAIDQAIGPKNDYWMRDAMGYAELVVPAWGVERKDFRAAYEAARETIRESTEPWHTPVEVLGYTKAGSPLHPLYVPYETVRQPWPFKA